MEKSQYISDIAGHHPHKFLRENLFCSVYTFLMITSLLRYTLKFEPYQGTEGRQPSECACLGVG